VTLIHFSGFWRWEKRGERRQKAKGKIRGDFRVRRCINAEFGGTGYGGGWGPSILTLIIGSDPEASPAQWLNLCLIRRPPTIVASKETLAKEPLVMLTGAADLPIFGCGLQGILPSIDGRRLDLPPSIVEFQGPLIAPFQIEIPELELPDSEGKPQTFLISVSYLVW
jgi:hypothetical protein